MASSSRCCRSRSARPLRRDRNRVAPRRRADPRPGQRPHPQPDDAAARRRRRPAADGVAAGHIWPIEGAVIGPEFVADGVDAGIAEMLRGGTTCCNENYFFPDVQAATYKRHGFRARRPAGDRFPDRVGEVVRRILRPRRRSARPVARRSAGRDRFRAARAVHRVAMRTSSASACWPTSSTCRCTCHVHETAHEVAESQQQHGQRPLARLDRLGWSTIA